MITKDMTIGTVISEYPEIVETLTGYGVHCVGCHVAAYETLEQGLKGHGMESEKIEEVIVELNVVLEKTRAVAEEEFHLTLTQAAVSKIRSLSEGNKVLRIVVKKGGCSGMSYDFLLEDEVAQENDVVIVQDSATVFVDKETFSKINGSVINYKDSLQGAGFQVENPQATSRCGCGKSFS